MSVPVYLKIAAVARKLNWTWPRTYRWMMAEGVLRETGSSHVVVGERLRHAFPEIWGRIIMDSPAYAETVMPVYLTITEAARALGWSRWATKRWAAREKILEYRGGHTVIVTERLKGSQSEVWDRILQESMELD